MRIRVDEIPDSGRFLHLHWDDRRLRKFLPPDDPLELKLARPVNIDLEIQKRPDHIRITGTILSILQLDCHRCLQSFLWHLEEEVSVYLVEEKKAPQEEETELEKEELEYEFFDGEIIEIGELVVEQIFLALPYKVLCSENCRGLCPHCGSNLNEEVCTCSTQAHDSPFAVLEKLKSRLHS